MAELDWSEKDWYSQYIKVCCFYCRFIFSFGIPQPNKYTKPKELKLTCPYCKEKINLKHDTLDKTFLVK